MNPLAAIYSGKSCGIDLFVAAVLTDRAKMLGMGDKQPKFSLSLKSDSSFLNWKSNFLSCHLSNAFHVEKK
ncbi:hypothetical protein IMY05_013G0096900 [Salix suchowensis]|nr:hypothetical protein IMY05_013G0096900 [Salix suchowensis]